MEDNAKSSVQKRSGTFGVDQIIFCFKYSLKEANQSALSRVQLLFGKSRWWSYPFTLNQNTAIAGLLHS